MNDPFVSCVMPTRGRQEYVRKALACYMAQTYGNRELVILDDADKPSFTAPPEIANVRYYQNPRRRSIPEKRNKVNELARGEIICHWDSDDWYSADRLEAQLRFMQESGKQVSGCHTILFYRDDTGQAWRYYYKPTYVLGTSQIYTKDFWRKAPFNLAMPFGSDNGMKDSANSARQLSSMNGERLIVARVHPDNSNGMKRPGVHWKTIEADKIPAEFFQ